MAQKRAEVRMIREILRLHFECGYADRVISRICGKSRPTVKTIYSNVEKAGYSWPLPEELDDAELDVLGTAEKIIVSKDETIIMGGAAPNKEDMFGKKLAAKVG